MNSSAVPTAIVFLAIIVFILARRTYAMIQGARYSATRIFVIAGFYLVLFAVLAFTTLYAAVGTWGPDAIALLAAYLAVPVLAAWLSAPYIRRIVRFEERAPGVWYYRLPWHVPVLTLGLFVVRYLIEILVFGIAFVTSYVLPTSLPPAVLVLLVAVDLLFGTSLGLMAGRGIGVHRAYGELPKDPISPGAALQSGRRQQFP
jgi:hypothetical protein